MDDLITNYLYIQRDGRVYVQKWNAESAMDPKIPDESEVRARLLTDCNAKTQFIYQRCLFKTSNYD